MRVNDQHYRTIWQHPEDPGVVQIIDQRFLPHEFVIEDLRSVEDMAIAIQEMHVRGAGLIGASAGWGMYLAAVNASKESLEEFMIDLNKASVRLKTTRPTAVNLEWAIERQMKAIRKCEGDLEKKVETTRETAQLIEDEDADFCRRIGEYGVEIIREIARQKGDVVNILTHCNAGWLAFVDFGTATSPIYAAHDAGIPVHVWVDETRPRNQGAALTAWELGQHGVDHTVIVDNAGGYLMQQGEVDLVLTGTDRTTYTGDVGNKIGTYLKALAAHDNGIPFYVALPSSTFDWSIEDGVRDIPIERREGDEVSYVEGLGVEGRDRVRIVPEKSPTANYAFDVTPARLVSGLITERGICEASAEGVLGLFPEMQEASSTA